MALSFVQHAHDIAELKKLVAGRAAVMAKLEKPAAIEHLDEIIEQSDGIMVARGDLGVEMPPEAVPPLQKRILAACRVARPAGDRRHADARIDGPFADADARRGVGRGDRGL